MALGESDKSGHRMPHAYSFGGIVENGNLAGRARSQKPSSASGTESPLEVGIQPMPRDRQPGFIRRVGTRNWMEVVGLILLLFAWYRHSTTVATLNQRIANWESFMVAAATPEATGLPDQYFELNLIVAGSPFSSTALNYADRYFYEPAWSDINVKRAWGRYMSAQYMWASQVEAFLFRQTPEGSPEMVFARELHREVETYDAEWARSFRGRDFDPAVLSAETAAQLDKRVVELKGRAAELSQAWAAEVRAFRRDQLRSYALLYLIGSILVIASRLMAANSVGASKLPTGRDGTVMR